MISSSERRAEEHMICYVMCTHDVLEIDGDSAAGQDISDLVRYTVTEERGE